ncbi:hypothetical protein ACS0TY_015925 [Phlomoides rotata]
MQTSPSGTGSLEVPQKPSPATPRTGRKLKSPGSASDSFTSPKSKTPNKSPKVVDRRSPRSPAIEKKKTSRVPELESQLSQLEDELKKAKEQLNSSESCKRRAQQEAEEARKQLASMSAKLEETQKQLNELFDSEESRVQELREISQDRDREWQCELEAVQKQHSMDSNALASALNEIQRLKIQLERVSESEEAQAKHAESAHGEIRSLRDELMETLDLVEKLKNQLNESRESEAEALEEVGRAQMMLEVVKATEETLRLEHADALQLCSLLEESRNRVISLEEIVKELESKIEVCENGEIDHLKNEANQLREALEEGEKRYQEQYIESTMQIREAYEMVKQAKSMQSRREAEMEAKLDEKRAEIEDFKAKLTEKEPNLEENELETELNKSGSTLQGLKTSLSEKETQLQSIILENEMLKSEILKKTKDNDEGIASARASEREALMKLGYVTEEVDKSCRKAERVTEELDAAQMANSEMETELRRLKVQSDQWRKAAEVAAAMLTTTGNNGMKYVERTGSLDYHTIGGKLSLPYSGDTDDESPKKKNGNVLKKIGVLLKKGQK